MKMLIIFYISPGSPGFGRAVATADLLLNPDRSSHRVNLPGRAGFNNCAFRAPHHAINC